MRNLKNIFRSAKKLGALSGLLALCGATTAVLGLAGPAVAFSSGAVILLIGMLYVLERRRQADQRKLLQGLERLSIRLSQTSVELKEHQKQHTKSLGLIFRELRTIESAVSGEESIIALRNEEQLATYLRAIGASTNLLLEAMVSQENAAVSGEAA